MALDPISYSSSRMIQRYFLFLTVIITTPVVKTLSSFAFRRFNFAQNDVCLRPHSFYTSESVKSPTGAIQKIEFSMRNVPGEGDCMFLAVALATSTSMGLGGNDSFLRAVSDETRAVVAQILAAPDGNLHVSRKRIVRVKDLLISAANEEGVTAEEYLEKVRSGELQGGGPELTALSNVLRRPIMIYELDEKGIMESNVTEECGIPERCKIKRVGSFGDIFKDPCLKIPNSAIVSGLQPGAYSWTIHILVVDAGPGYYCVWHIGDGLKVRVI